MSQSTNKQFPVFPAEVIKGPAKKFVDLYSPIREVPSAFLWASFCSYFGNAICQHASIQTDNSEPRLYTVLLGRSAKTKKSTSNDLARDFFREVTSKDSSQSIIEGFGSAEGLIKELSLNEGKTTVLHLDELSVLARKTSSENSAGIAPLHKLFEGHRYDNPLAAGGTRVKDARLSLVAASTLEDFQRSWTSRQSDAGFFSRLFLVGADSTEKRIAFPKSAEKAPYLELVAEVQGLISALGTLKPKYVFEEEASKHWEDFYRTIGDGSEWNRIDVIGFRLMVIQAALTKSDSVSLEIVEDVVKLLQFEVLMRQASVPVIADTQIAELEEHIRRCLSRSGELTRRELYRSSNANRKGIEMFDKALNNLERNGELMRTRKGRSERFEALEPELSEQNEEGLLLSSVIASGMTDLVPLDPCK